MPWFESIANFACECMFFVGNVLTDAAIRITDFVDKVRTSIRPNILPQIDAQSQLHDINLEIEDIRRRYNRDQRLSSQDRERLHELKMKRDQLKRDIWSARENSVLQNISARPEAVRSVIITPEPKDLHIVQYHVGQTASGKKCPNCGKEMMLRINNNTRRPFWGCVGYFSTPSCDGNEIYRQGDGQLFIPSEIPELEVSNDILNSIYSNSAVQRQVSRRMQQHHMAPTDEYNCPTHGERLILKQRDIFQGALDQFNLICPFRESAINCRYTVKIKTPAQLAAVLKAYEGRGIL